MLTGAGPNPQSAPAPSLATAYALLFGIDVHHRYCNAAAGRFGGIGIMPSPVTRQRLVSYGLLARPRADGIDILYDERRPGALLKVLEGGPLWFVMVLNEPLFFNFTDVPTDFRSGRPVFLFTSRNATPIGPHRSRLDLGWEPFESGPARPPVNLAGADAPQGAWVDRLGGPAAAAAERAWFQSQLPDPPFGLIEIAPRQEGSPPGVPEPSTYEIAFGARDTYWRYLIAGRGDGLEPEPPVGPLPPDEPGRPWFEPSGSRILPDGTPASVFDATRPITLLQRPEIVFALRGKSGGGRSRLLVRQLPAPSAAAIRTGPPPPGTSAPGPAVWSEIYVFV